MFNNKRRLECEILELTTAGKELHEKSKPSPLRRRLSIWMTHLKTQLEELLNQHTPEFFEAHPDSFERIISKDGEQLAKLLYGDDQKPLTSGAYLGNDDKIYSVETVYEHICCASTRDSSPLVPAFSKPWAVTQHQGIARLIRFSKRNAIVLDEPDNHFWQNLGLTPIQEDIAPLLPYALNQHLTQQIDRLHQVSTQAMRICDDLLSQKLIEWSELLINLLTLLRDENGHLRANPNQISLLKEFLVFLRQNDGTIPEKIDEWVILEYYHDLLCHTILIDPITNFPLKRQALILNDQTRRTFNPSTVALLQATYPDIQPEPHPALDHFFDWIEEYTPHLKAIRIQRRHLSAEIREQDIKAYRHAQAQLLVNSLSKPTLLALATARQKIQQKLDVIEDNLRATDENVARLSEHTQRTDAKLQKLKIDMEECAALWEDLLYDLLPKQDEEIEQGLNDLQKIQEKAHALEIKATKIHQQLVDEVEKHKKEDSRLKEALSHLDKDVDAVAYQQHCTAIEINALEQSIAASKKSIFGELAIAAGFIIGTLAGCGVGAIALNAGISAQMATLAGVTTAATVTTLFSAAAGQHAGERGYQHSVKLGSTT